MQDFQLKKAFIEKKMNALDDELMKKSEAEGVFLSYEKRSELLNRARQRLLEMNGIDPDEYENLRGTDLRGREILREGQREESENEERILAKLVAEDEENKAFAKDFIARYKKGEFENKGFIGKVKSKFTNQDETTQ